MSNYSNIPHPLLSDSGTCQSERYPALLNPDAVNIDDQSLEDVLLFVNKYARFINFYDEEYNISNWQELFSKSLPVQLAVLSKLDVNELEANLDHIIQLVDKFPTQENIQILLDFVFAELISVFESSLGNVQNVNTSFSVVLQRIMSSNLRDPLVNFISLTNRLVEKGYAKGIHFNDQISFDNWGISSIDDIELSILVSKIELVQAVERNANIFLNELRLLAKKTSHFLPQVLYPNSEDQQGKITPHIGLLIAFLELKRHFISDLNDITRKHLRYFYNDVLQIKGKPARPDETFIVFQLQKQVNDSYFLPKGTKVKDGKDDNKADIIFGLEKDIVLDKAEIKELRTLYLNPVKGYIDNNLVGSSGEESGSCTEEDLVSYTEGLYIAPKANSLDGVEEDFKEDPKNWATLGSKESKLLVEGAFQDHPSARVGFILSSPVLLLNEGKRTIKVELACTLDNANNKVDLDLFEKVKGYFEINLNGLINARSELEEEVFNKLLQRICPRPQTLVVQAVDNNCSQFIDERNLQAILNFLSLSNDVESFSYGIKHVIDLIASDEIDEETGNYLYSNLACKTQLTILDFIAIGFNDFLSLKSLFYKQPFKIYLSGDKGWLDVPNESISFNLQTGAEIKIFLTIALKDDFPAVTFADVEVLGEEIGTTHPSLKMELDSDYKMVCPSELYQPCCSLSHCQEEGDIFISAYHFLNHLKIDNSCIEVEVCGVKNLIVQNDESVQDVNGLIYPFGTRPRYEENDAAPYSAQGSNFYIGSHEVFCKNWTKFWVNINWKDKPASFGSHYLAYQNASSNIGEINGDLFKVKMAYLKNGKWKKEEASVIEDFLFNKDNDTTNDRNVPSIECGRNKKSFQRIFEFNPTDFDLGGQKLENEKEVNQTFSIKSKNGFLRLTLTGLDFQHANYPFILARQMMAFGKLEVDGKSVYVPGAVYYDSTNINFASPLTQDEFDATIKKSIISVDLIFRQIEIICKLVEAIYDKLEKVIQLFYGSSNFVKDSDFSSLRGRLDALLINIDILNVATVSSLITDLGGVIGDFVNNAAAGDFIEDGIIQEILNNLGNALKLTQDQINCIIGDLGSQALPSNLDPLSFTMKFSDYLSALEDELTNTGFKYGVDDVFIELNNFLTELKSTNTLSKALGVLIPNEPWTPIIKDISLDYTAKAEDKNIQLIHLYPFENTYKLEDITTSPNLFPEFKDEGTLYIALDKVIKGNTLNLLFNMAEATANTEMSKPEINWSYLKNNNEWEELQDGFSIAHDGTDGLTKTGIVEIVIPADMSKEDHTIMPPDCYWIKVAAPTNSKAVCETISIHTQAAKVIAELSPKNDLNRLGTALPTDKISRLAVADTSIKKVSQPIPSINGRPPESDAPSLLYRRISERLRHKGRAINNFDYERIVLENFSQIFKAKTISHTLGLPGSQFERDLEVVAPGHVLVAVIPDIKQLNSGNALEPRVPLSQLTAIKSLLQKKNSHFIKLKVENPRYEKVNVAIKAQFGKGKTGPYYEKQLEMDIQKFLAPWLQGNTNRLHFGGILSKSDLISFVEGLFYVDYICQIDWVHEYDLNKDCTQKKISCCEIPKEDRPFITPMTARSILTAGEISTCELTKRCKSYDETVSCEQKSPSVVIL